jgi:hypothetical protein
LLKPDARPFTTGWIENVADRYTKAEVADIIERFLDGGGGAWDWDDFLSIRIADPELDGVRQRCIATRDETYRNQWCGPAGFAELRRIVAQLRSAS